MRNPDRVSSAVGKGHWLGVFVMMATLGGAAAWSASVPIASAIVASGEIVVSDQRKIVQSSEDGIVAEIHVRDGAHVKAGAPLVDLQQTDVEIERQRLESAIRALDRRLKLLREEYADVASLYERGYAAKPRYMTLKRQVVELEGERAEQTLRLAGLSERAARHVVRAPVAGVVIGLKTHTVGGVVKPGETLLELVPADARMMVEARIGPAERESVQPGQAVEVRLTSIDRKSTPTIAGAIAHVSADALRDERTGTSYFIARTALDARSLAAANVERLQPGMPVDMMINTGTQTPIGYLMKPLRDGLARTMR